MKLALKVDVDTYRGTRAGVPRLVKLLEKYQAGATFLFSLGADHTGRAIRRALRPGFMQKISRTSVLEHYGVMTLLYGTVLPGPDIGRRCAAIMRSVRDAGFEVGIHTWDHVKWQDHVAQATSVWTCEQLERAIAAFETIFGFPPRIHGAAGWQVNPYVPKLEEGFRFEIASDTRGFEPFMPADGGIVQIPTTLPTLDELIGVKGMQAGAATQRIFELSRVATPRNHVFTLHAELEGGAHVGTSRSPRYAWRISLLAITSAVVPDTSIRPKSSR